MDSTGPSTEKYKPILQTGEVAELLGMHVNQIRNWTKEGRIPAYRLPDARSYHYVLSEIIDWMRTHATQGQRPNTVPLPDNLTPVAGQLRRDPEGDTYQLIDPASDEPIAAEVDIAFATAGWVYVSRGDHWTSHYIG